MTVIKERRIRRNANDAREACLAAARELLLTEGPAAVLLSRIGKATGMSHTNIIHHFGSAGGLQSELMGRMVRDLMKALDDIVGRVRNDESAPAVIVDHVFDAFAKGGGGHLAAWLVLANEYEHIEPIQAAVVNLVDVMTEKFPDAINARSRMRTAVLLIAISAFGDAVIGPYLRTMLDMNDNAMRAMVSKLIPLFFLPAMDLT